MSLNKKNDKAMIYCISKRMEVAAAHKLELSYESKCRRLHGHNYIITVYMVCRDQLNKDGMVYDFKHVKDRVHDYLDHGYLNELLPFNTTAENMARWIVEQFAECYKAVVQESEGNVAQAVDETKIKGIENLVM